MYKNIQVVEELAQLVIILSSTEYRHRRMNFVHNCEIWGQKCESERSLKCRKSLPPLSWRPESSRGVWLTQGESHPVERDGQH